MTTLIVYYSSDGELKKFKEENAEILTYYKDKIIYAYKNEETYVGVQIEVICL